VGLNDGGGTLSGDAASETVTGTSYVGGLAGVNVGSVSGSLSTSTVTGTSGVGGLVGYNAGAITSSFALAGAVTGTGYSSNNIGGLVGLNDGGGVISNTYAMGPVSGATQVGGLVGLNVGMIATSYATGAVSGTADLGGVAWANLSGAVVQNVYWDVTKTGRSSAVGSNTGTLTNVLGVGGSTGRDPHAQATYAGFDFINVWAITPGVSRPYLKAVAGSAPPS
jgi:hypothetical protein